MSENKKSDLDPEKIMITLDHIGETIDAMSNILGRLRNYMNTHTEETRTDRFLEAQQRSVLRRQDGSCLNKSEIFRSKKTKLLH